jgi:hypothetical protein
MAGVPELEALAEAIRVAMGRPDIAQLAEAHRAEADRRGLISDWGEYPEWRRKLEDAGRLVLAAAHVLPAGGSVETGVFRGGSSAPLMLCAPAEAFHVTIDPFGLPSQSYADWDYYTQWPAVRRTVHELAQLARERDITFCHYMMGAQAFIDADLLQHPGRFRIVHLDGDHSLGAVARELQYFRSKISGPTLFILDDHDENSPGVQAGLDAAGVGLVRILHNYYALEDDDKPFGFSAWLHAWGDD